MQRVMGMKRRMLPHHFAPHHFATVRFSQPRKAKS
jgi:hypothetical protein